MSRSTRTNTAQWLDFARELDGTALACFPGVAPRWRVLIIDDYESSRAALTEAITAQGGHVVGHGSRAEDAARLVDLHDPDVTVLPFGLGDGDGLEAARRVMSAHPSALVLLTGRTNAQVDAQAATAGIAGFLAPPIQAEDVGPAFDLAVSRFRDREAARGENLDLRRKLASRRLIDRAKALLIDRFSLTEPEAHRRIQKAAMDNRRTMADIARSVLVGEELGRSRPAS